MIIPARWYSGGVGLDRFREMMLSNNNLRELHDFKNPYDCFESVGISGGVCYFLIDKSYSGNPTIYNKSSNKVISKARRKMIEDGLDVFIRDNQAVQIYNKVKSQKERSFESVVSSQTPFGILSSFKEYEDNPFNGSIKIYLKDKNIGYISKEQVKKRLGLIDKNKVYLSKAYSMRATFPQPILNKPFIGEVNSCCSQTYLLIGPFDDEKISNNVVSYINTKFFRFMCSLIKNSQDNMKKTFRAVPLQDFSKEWSDEELYEKYNISQKEIEYIESIVSSI